jgi:FixJ family two-component response regulator
MKSEIECEDVGCNGQFAAILWMGVMTKPDFTAFVVDDNVRVLKALGRLLDAAGYDSRTYLSAEDFLSDHDPNVPGCVILDLMMPGLNGLRLQEKLTHQGISRPIIFLTGQGDIPTSVRAMKAGAVDFLTKPVNRGQLFTALARAIELDAAARREREDLQLIEARLITLTPREREVLTYVVAGRLNKQIAASLGTVEKTIKVHRKSVMEKLGVRSVADLVRLTERAGVKPATTAP